MKLGHGWLYTLHGVYNRYARPRLAAPAVAISQVNGGAAAAASSVDIAAIGWY